MGFDQYHEPATELSQETRTFARMIASLTEECEAIGWYQQRISIEQDAEARSIMANAQEEEFLHFAMDLEFHPSHTEMASCASKSAFPERQYHREQGKRRRRRGQNVVETRNISSVDTVQVFSHQKGSSKNG